jgi:hypothetical protein
MEAMGEDPCLVAEVLAAYPAIAARLDRLLVRAVAVAEVRVGQVIPAAAAEPVPIAKR